MPSIFCILVTLLNMFVFCKKENHMQKFVILHVKKQGL